MLCILVVLILVLVYVLETTERIPARNTALEKLVPGHTHGLLKLKSSGNAKKSPEDILDRRHGLNFISTPSLGDDIIAGFSILG